jgi:glutamate---cysteine ligase / carboxylate-amine ligase
MGPVRSLPRLSNGSSLAAVSSQDSLLGPQALEQRLRSLFDRVAPFTVGAEEELLLVDAHTLLPAPAAEYALALGAGDRRLAGELRSAQVEAMTPVCVSVADVARELASIRRLVATGLGPDVLVVGTGAHPLTTDPGPLSSAQRYRRLAAEHPWAARSAVTCGLHVHVAVSGADRALAVYNALRSYLPELLALGANAPYYGGDDSGLATVRAKLNQSWPRAGVPPAFASWRELAEFAVWARDGGAMPEAGHQWWDLRLSAAHGTIELRVADTQTRVDDAATLIALAQSLVADLAARHEAGEQLPVHRDERIVENMWLATRDGIGGHLIDPETGARTWTADRLQELASSLMPTATTLGCDRELLGIGRLVLDGGGAARQRGMVRRRGLESLLPKLAEETSSPTAEEAEARMLGGEPATGTLGAWG